MEIEKGKDEKMEQDLPLEQDSNITLESSEIPEATTSVEKSELQSSSDNQEEVKNAPIESQLEKNDKSDISNDELIRCAEIAESIDILNRVSEELIISLEQIDKEPTDGKCNQSAAESSSDAQVESSVEIKDNLDIDDDLINCVEEAEITEHVRILNEACDEDAQRIQETFEKQTKTDENEISEIKDNLTDPIVQAESLEKDEMTSENATHTSEESKKEADGDVLTPSTTIAELSTETDNLVLMDTSEIDETNDKADEASKVQADVSSEPAAVGELTNECNIQKSNMKIHF